MSKSLTTRFSILDWLPSGDETAWLRFEEKYKQIILFWLRRIGVKENDREDIYQDVSVKFLTKKVEHDPAKGRFRSQLNVIVRNTAMDFFRKDKRYQENPVKHCNKIKIAMNLDSENEKGIWNKEWKKHVLELAKEEIFFEYKVSERDQELFNKYDKKKGWDWVVKAFGMKPNTASKRFNEIKRLVQIRVRNIERFY